jgi:hypothetical protein|tara:strand:- start:293 stop:583 length:291 start_codon:yes stop_codon:yes gene_type:complete
MVIKCKWLETNRILVNPDGQVLPCCYLANNNWVQKQNGITKECAVMQEYNDNKEKYNIHNNDMKDIINGEWFTKTLPDSWKDETKTITQCKTWCGE